MRSSLLQGAVGIGLTALVLGICFALFAIRLATRSHPKAYQESQVSVTDTVRVYRNSFGIPHISAATTEDMLFGQGYTHAQDRLWQMDVWRRAGRGKLAEILGPRLVQADVFMRALNISGIALENYRVADTLTRRLLQAYTRGVNAYIEENQGSLPFEFDALGYAPEPWSPEDCIIVGRVLAFEVSLAFWTDITFAQIAYQRGLAAYKEYVPQGPFAPYVLDTVSATRIDTTLSTAMAVHSLRETGAQFLNVASVVRSVRQALGMQGSGYGSNCWAIRTPEGSIVANDPHLTVSMPPKWYQIHLSAPGINAIGMSIPGIPFILSGRTDHVAWGFTNAMIDDIDYVAERIDSTNANYYFEPSGNRVKFRYRRDTIHIKDRPDSLVDFRATSRSIVLSDVHMFRDPSMLFSIPRSTSAGILQKYCLSVRWTATYRSNEILCLYKMCKARSVNEFASSLQTWGAPCLTFSVGTADGHVANMVAGYIPVRGSSDANLPIALHTPGADWTGVRPARELGMLLDPSRGWVASANNKLSSRSDVAVPGVYEPASRATRIAQLMGIYRTPTVRDVQVMQQDIQSPYAVSMLRRVLPVLKKGMTRYGDGERRALAVLEKWDGTQSALDAGATIMSMLTHRLLWNLFEDELGQQLYYDWTLVSNVPLRRLDELMNEPTNVLWDDSRTPHRETFDWIAIRSFIETMREISKIYGDVRDSSWRYGAIHTISFPHIFGENELMRPVMNLGPFEVGGSQTTINNTEWAIASPYATRVAASMRVISDMNDSLQYSVVPGGSSGQPLSPHYADQLQLWLKGGYVRLPIGAKPDVSFRLYHVLVP